MTAKSRAYPDVWQVRILAALIFTFLAATSVQARQVGSTEPMAELLPDGQGKEIVLTTCTKCHNIDRIVHGHRYQDQWQSLVKQMISNGAALNEDDMPVLVDYLAKNFPGVARPEAAVVPGPVEASIKEWKIPNP